MSNYLIEAATEFMGMTEAKKDGSISSDEAAREAALMQKIEDHIHGWKQEAQHIGGDFRAPGIISRIKKAATKHLSK